MLGLPLEEVVVGDALLEKAVEQLVGAQPDGPHRVPDTLRLNSNSKLDVLVQTDRINASPSSTPVEDIDDIVRT